MRRASIDLKTFVRLYFIYGSFAAFKWRRKNRFCIDSQPFVAERLQVVCEILIRTQHCNTCSAGVGVAAGNRVPLILLCITLTQQCQQMTDAGFHYVGSVCCKTDLWCHVKQVKQVNRHCSVMQHCSGLKEHDAVPSFITGSKSADKLKNQQRIWFPKHALLHPHLRTAMKEACWDCLRGTDTYSSQTYSQWAKVDPPEGPIHSVGWIWVWKLYWKINF